MGAIYLYIYIYIHILLPVQCELRHMRHKPFPGSFSPDNPGAVPGSDAEARYSLPQGSAKAVVKARQGFGLLHRDVQRRGGLEVYQARVLTHVTGELV